MLPHAWSALWASTHPPPGPGFAQLVLLEDPLSPLLPPLLMLVFDAVAQMNIRLLHTPTLGYGSQGTDMSYKIRTITVGVTLERGGRDSGWAKEISQAVLFLDSAKGRMEGLGCEVQTIRITTNSFEVCILCLWCLRLTVLQNNYNIVGVL
jgi:hypothetical protein